MYVVGGMCAMLSTKESAAMFNKAKRNTLAIFWLLLSTQHNTIIWKCFRSKVKTRIEINNYTLQQQQQRQRQQSYHWKMKLSNQIAQEISNGRKNSHKNSKQCGVCECLYECAYGFCGMVRIHIERARPGQKLYYIFLLVYFIVIN